MSRPRRKPSKSKQPAGGSRGGLRPSLKAARASKKAQARARGATRKQRVRVAQRLKRQGLSSREIGARLGLAPSTVRDLLTDPTRSNAKRRQKNALRRTHRRKAHAWRRGGPVERRPDESLHDFKLRQKRQRGMIVRAYVERAAEKAAAESEEQ